MAPHANNPGDINSDDRILRLREVEAIVGLKRSTIYRKLSTNNFPRPRRLCGSSVGWLNSEIQSWIRQREVL